MPEDEDTPISLAEVATRLGIPYPTVYQHSRKGRLHATLVEGRVMVLPAEIERYRREVMDQSPYRGRRGVRLRGLPAAE